MSTEKKRNANRLNGQKSRGPKNTNRTRYNARKHGLLAADLTELDLAAGFRSILRKLCEEKKPVGVIEEYLVQEIAFDITRTPRARGMEAAYITSVLHPPKRAHQVDNDALLHGEVLDPGRPASIGPNNVDILVNKYQRYESMFHHKLHKNLHELERIQRMRKGDRVAAPESLDVTLEVIPASPESPTGTAPCLLDDADSGDSDLGCSLEERASTTKTASTGEQQLEAENQSVNNPRHPDHQS